MSATQILSIDRPQVRTASGQNTGVPDVLIPLQRVDKGHQGESWALTLSSGEVTLRDASQQARAFFPLTQAHSRIQIPSFAQSIKHMGVTLDDGSFVQFNAPAKQHIRQLRTGAEADPETHEAALLKLSGAFGLMTAGFVIPAVMTPVFRFSELWQPQVYTHIGIFILAACWSGAGAYLSRRFPLASVLLVTIPIGLIMVTWFIVSAAAGGRPSLSFPAILVTLGIGSAWIALPGARHAAKSRRAGQSH